MTSPHSPEILALLCGNTSPAGLQLKNSLPSHKSVWFSFTLSNAAGTPPSPPSLWILNSSDVWGGGGISFGIYQMLADWMPGWRNFHTNNVQQVVQHSNQRLRPQQQIPAALLCCQTSNCENQLGWLNIWGSSINIFRPALAKRWEMPQDVLSQVYLFILYAAFLPKGDPKCHSSFSLPPVSPHNNPVR